MIPKVHAKGSSFSGAANYLLHDKDHAITDDRVSWTSTRNLATQNPHAAWRVMAATAMDQQRLKSEAGIKNTGRKSNKSVLHMSLAWHPDEADGLTREEMMRAAHGAIKALGAEDRQAMFVSHDDEPQPHVHILINRVSPEDGRMLPSSNEKRNLSKWAQEYETQRGEILCEQRVINNAARDRGEYTRGEPNKPRHIFELEATNDNKPGVEAIKAEQKKRDLVLSRKTRELKERQKQEANKLAAKHKEQRAKTQAKAKIDALKARDQIRAKYRPVWEQRFHEHQAELKAFEKREDQLLGRVGNALRSIDFGKLLGSSDRKEAFKDAYNTVSTSGGRLEAFKKSQLARDRQLERNQRVAEVEAMKRVKTKATEKLSEQRMEFKDQRASMGLKHGLEHAANRSEWKTRSEQRTAAFDQSHSQSKSRGPENQRESTGKQTTKTSPEIERLLDSYKKRRQNQQEQTKEQDNERDRDGRTR